MSNELKLDKNRITHDLKCENCGDPATVNYQLAWVSWNITPDGSFVRDKLHIIDENEFWCSRCWELDRNEKIGELNKIWEAWKK